MVQIGGFDGLPCFPLLFVSGMGLRAMWMQWRYFFTMHDISNFLLFSLSGDGVAAADLVVAVQVLVLLFFFRLGVALHFLCGDASVASRISRLIVAPFLWLAAHFPHTCF